MSKSTQPKVERSDSTMKVSWFRIVSLSLAVLPSMNASQAGTAFWGSFGDAAAQVECVVLRNGENGTLLGYDRDSQVAVFAESMRWTENGKFDFDSLVRQGASKSRALGTGRLRPLVDGTQLEGSIATQELAFSSHRESAGTYQVLALEGKLDARLHLIFGAAGDAFGLYLDSEGGQFGSLVEILASDAYRLRTERGDFFEFRRDLAGEINAARFQLSDGQAGSLIDENPPSNRDTAATSVATVSNVWWQGSKMAGEATGALHFLLEGEGSKDVSISADLAWDVLGVESVGAASDFALVICQLDASGSYKEIQRVTSFSRAKWDASTIVNLPGYALFRSETSYRLGEGMYLAYLDGVRDCTLISQIDVSLGGDAGGSDIDLINASVLYRKMGSRLEHTLGFHVEGSGALRSLVRNVGPSLRQHSVEQVSLDPQLALLRNGVKEWKNEDWWQVANVDAMVEFAAGLGAFPLQNQSADAGLAIALGEGDYEAVGSDDVADFGYELLEAYFSFQSAAQ